MFPDKGGVCGNAVEKILSGGVRHSREVSSVKEVFMLFSNFSGREKGREGVGVARRGRKVCGGGKFKS